MNKRMRNEKTFGQWEPLPGGGRRYWLDVYGHNNWKARYVKEVDPEEKTILFLQKIYDNSGCLIEIHEKYPEDKGHRPVKEGDN